MGAFVYAGFCLGRLVGIEPTGPIENTQLADFTVSGLANKANKSKPLTQNNTIPGYVFCPSIITAAASRANPNRMADSVRTAPGQWIEAARRRVSRSEGVILTETSSVRFSMFSVLGL